MQNPVIQEDSKKNGMLGSPAHYEIKKQSKIPNVATDYLNVLQGL